jgi:hypothetical protein
VRFRCATTNAALLLIASLCIGVALAQSQEDKRRADYRVKMERLFRIEKRAKDTRPYRREIPIRVDNIKDEEVQEILNLMARVRPGAIVNIGTVVLGCPCEDGSSCSDQVWVVAHGSYGSVGLLLSKIDSHWAVGPVQKWWLEREDLEGRRKSFSSPFAYFDAVDALTERFPACLVPK